jgi:L-lactate utilization protein LutB
MALPLGTLAKFVSAPSPQEWAVPSPEESDGSALLTQTAQRCTRCGACVSACPAYLLTGDELVTARAKLQLSDALFRDVAVQPDEAFRPFQCIRCGLCEEVCQTRLPLRDCYDKLEQRVVRHYGSYPAELVQGFVARVDERREWMERTFGLDLADWAPAELTPRFSKSRNAIEQRG